MDQKYLLCWKYDLIHTWEAELAISRSIFPVMFRYSSSGWYAMYVSVCTCIRWHTRGCRVWVMPNVMYRLLLNYHFLYMVYIMFFFFKLGGDHLWVHLMFEAKVFWIIGLKGSKMDYRCLFRNAMDKYLGRYQLT